MFYIALTMFVLLMLAMASFKPVRACNKIACAALTAGCSGICACDYPVCECCPQCLACLGSMWAQCCNCFGKCNSLKSLAVIRPQLIVNTTLQEELLVATGLMPSLPEAGRQQVCSELETAKGGCSFLSHCLSCGSQLPESDLTCCQGQWLNNRRSDCCQ